MKNSEQYSLQSLLERCNCELKTKEWPFRPKYLKYDCSETIQCSKICNHMSENLQKNCKFKKLWRKFANWMKRVNVIKMGNRDGES